MRPASAVARRSHGLARQLRTPWDLALENLSPATPGDTGVEHILAVLQEQLARLDQLGARIAAAHLDAAIQQLRLEQARRC